MPTPTPDPWDILTSVDLMTPIPHYPASPAWAYIVLVLLLAVLVIALVRVRRARGGN